MNDQDNQPAEKEESPIGGIIVGLFMVFIALAAVLNIYTILPHTKKGWLSLGLWLQMLFYAIIATSCFYGSLKEMKKSIKIIKKRNKEL